MSLAKAWFTPSLIVNHDAICGAILAGTRTKFATSFSWESHEGNAFPGLTQVPGPFEGASGGDADFQEDPTDPTLFILHQRTGQNLYVHFQNNPGCGGACESESVWVSAQPPREGGDDRGDAATPAAAAGWEIYRSAKGDYYLVGTDEGRQEVYKVVAPKNWRLSCAVSLAPERLQQTKNPSVLNALAAIRALDDTVGAMAGGAGYCGTMATSGRWRGDTQAALEETLYRPWASVPIGSSSANSYGLYSSIWPSLVDWSLGGPGRVPGTFSYQTQLSRTTQVLAGFYQDKFGWSQQDSTDVAHEALINAVSHNFGFYLYETYPDAHLRQLILDHAEMAAIRAINMQPANDNRDGSNNLLSIAVEYPEALKYLLAKGFNPNVANAFGKTPLMYAAQYDQLESTRILLTLARIRTPGPSFQPIPAITPCTPATCQRCTTPSAMPVRRW